jgi:hypothetical protein
MWLSVMLVVLGTACVRADPVAEERIVERDQLLREVEGLRELENVAPGKLMDREHEVLISVRDTLLQSLLAATLPVSVDIRNDITVTVTGARVTFRSNVARVALSGHARRRSFPRVAAIVRLRGALDEFSVDAAQGLRSRIAIDAVEIDAPTGAISALDPLVIEALRSIVERSLPELTSAIPALSIPVRLDQNMTLPGFGPDGALSITPSAAPLRMSASRVIAFQNRLWIVLRAELGAFAAVARDTTR